MLILFESPRPSLSPEKYLNGQGKVVVVWLFTGVLIDRAVAFAPQWPTPSPHRQGGGHSVNGSFPRHPGPLQVTSVELHQSFHM